jgi:cytidylate kinase
MTGLSSGKAGDAADASSFSGVVALDGPSGTGKSTVARRLASRLGARYLDTGAMYRAATLAVLRAGADPSDAPAVATIVRAAAIEISTDPAAPSARLDGEPVDRDIRSAPVTAAVSAVSAVADVRSVLIGAQREIISAATRDGGIVVEGRDIGAVVWPAARPKVFLTASPRARAERRAGELSEADVAAVAADIERRDTYDSTRGGFVRAADALTLDTTDLGIDAVVEQLALLAAGAPAGHA